MRSRLIAKLMYLGLSATFIVALGFSQLQREIEVKIPFDFIAMDRTYEAGTYHVGINENGLTLLAPEHGSATMFNTRPLGSVNIPQKPCLKFTRYGSQYFLTQVWGRRGVELFKSKAEKRLARNTSPLEVASVNVR